MSDEPTANDESSDAEAPDKKSKSAKAPKPAKPPKAAQGKSAKKGGFPIVLVLIPIAVIAAAVLAFALPPTHALLVKSPLGPVIARFSHSAADPKGTAAAQKSADPAAEVKRLTDAVDAAKKTAAEKDATISQLQADAAKTSPPPADSAAAPAAKPTTTPVPDDVKRAAAVWAAMDADKAADIIKQLPDAYVEAVFGQMPADAVSDIMSELPPKTAARLTTDAVTSPGQVR